MKSIYLLIALFFCLQNSSAQTFYVGLKIDGEIQKLNENFELFFVIEDSLKKVIYKPVINGNSFEYSQLNISSNSGYFVLKYKDLYLGFGPGRLDYNFSLELNFEYITKQKHIRKFYPHDLESKRLAYLHINPLEVEEGVYEVRKIQNVKTYQKSIIELLR